jgi:hypothetical protein
MAEQFTKPCDTAVGPLAFLAFAYRRALNTDSRKTIVAALTPQGGIHQPDESVGE